MGAGQLRGLRSKRTQHFNATYPNIVAPSMLQSFDHPVETFDNMLDDVGPSLKMA